MPVSKRRKKPKAASRPKSGDPRRTGGTAEAFDYTIALVTEAFLAARVTVDGPTEVLASALPDLPPAGTRLDAIAAGEYLTNVRESLESQARDVAVTYSAVRWLWYTRRISTESFAGHLITTQFADHKILEALSGLSTNLDEDKIEIEGRFIYPTDVIDLIPVARMASIAVALSQCHGWLRRAGKGTEFVVRGDELPAPVLDDALEHAIELFDDRVAEDLRWQWHPSLEMNAIPANKDDPPPVLMTLSRLLGPWTEVAGWQGSLQDQRAVRVIGQFSMNWATLGGLADSVASAKNSSVVWWKPHTPSLVTLLFTLWYDAAFMSQSLGLSLPKVGYLRRKRDYAIHAIDQLMPLVVEDLERYFPGQVPRSGTEVLGVLEGLGPDMWPVETGPVVRALGDDVVLDVWAASSRLHEDIRIPAQTGGALVNAPALRFEDVVQERVDETPWRPTESTRALRRTLRLNGDSITNIDAVAEHDDVLLLISCKNIPFTRAYDAGDYNTVRNAATTVNKAIAYWQTDVVAELTRCPIGDNYDVSQFAEIRGVVVTPQVVYSRDANAIAEQGVGPVRLRNVQSIGELMRALG